MVNGEAESLITYTISREKAGTREGELVGDYTITPTGAAAQGNYTVTYVTGTLTITGDPIIPEKTTPTVTSNYNLGDKIPFAITVHNVTDHELENITVSEQSDAVIETGTGYTLSNGVATIASLAADATVTVNAYHIVTSADILAATYGNTATVGYDNKNYDADGDTDKIVPPDVTLNVTKEADVEEAKIGETINYTITVENAGNVPYYNVTVNDPETGDDWTIAMLAVGESKTFTTAHVVVEADVAAQTFKNTVTAQGDPIDSPSSDRALIPEGSAEVNTLIDNHFVLTYAITGTYLNNTAYFTSTVEYGTQLTLITDDMSDEHYDWSGWTGLPETMPAKDVTVSGHYTPKDFTLTVKYVYAGDKYQAAGNPAAATHTETVTYNETYSVTSPSIANYTADINVVSGTMENNLTVTVTYSLNRHSLTIHYNYANGTQAADDYYGLFYVGDAYDVSSPAIGGYTADITSLYGKMEDKDLGFYVVYTAERIIPPVPPTTSYTVSYDANGGEGAPAGATYAAGATVTVAAGIPTREGYTFEGWTYAANTYAAGETFQMPASNVTLRASWTAAETIPEVVIPETPTPETAGGAWALINLILMVVTALLSIILVLGFFFRKEKFAARFSSLIPAIGGVIAFFLTENMRNPMCIWDKWTLLMAIIALVQIVVVFVARHKKDDDDDEDEENAKA